jgi:hypothetical protein
MVVEIWHRMSYTMGEENEGKEESKMLPLEVIGVLGLLYIFFMIGTVRALRAKSAVRRKAKVRPRPKPVVGDVATEPVKPIF